MKKNIFLLLTLVPVSLLAQEKATKQQLVKHIESSRAYHFNPLCSMDTLYVEALDGRLEESIFVSYWNLHKGTGFKVDTDKNLTAGPFLYEQRNAFGETISTRKLTLEFQQVRNNFIVKKVRDESGNEMFPISHKTCLVKTNSKQ